MHNRRPIHRIPPWVLLAMVTLLAGCLNGGMRGGQDAMLASAVRDPVLQDIPRPQGFEIDEQKSMAFASGRARVARCHYRGSIYPIGVKRFYERYMPAANFKLVQWSLEEGVYQLRFASDGELCNIRTWREPWRTALVIELGPRPSGSAERPDQAPTPMPRRG
jgi:hypothetical protein